IRRALKRVTHLEPIKRSICLRPRRTHGGPARSIQKAKLYTGAIDDAAHNSSECVNLADQMTFSDSADGGIAGHLPYKIQVKSEKRRSGSDPGRGRSGFASRMTATYYDHIKCLIENHKELSSIWNANKCRFSFAYAECREDSSQNLVGCRLTSYFSQTSKCVVKPYEHKFLTGVGLKQGKR